MSGHEIQFARKVEELFSTVTFPEYRQIIVEVSNQYNYSLLDISIYKNDEDTEVETLSAFQKFICTSTHFGH